MTDDEFEAEVEALLAETVKLLEQDVVSDYNLEMLRRIDEQFERAERALADRSNAVKVLRAIAEGYHVFGAEDRYVVVANPAFQPDDSSDPCLVVDISTLTTEPAAPECQQEAGADAVRFLYKHGALTHIAAHEAVELLTSNGFEISRRSK